jgi:hypothetical protein
VSGAPGQRRVIGKDQSSSIFADIPPDRAYNPAAMSNATAIPASVPLRQRINFRIVGFLAVLGLMLGYPLYIYLDSMLTGGIKQRADGYTEVNLKAMSTFTFDQKIGTIDDVPAKWRALDGKKVILVGEIAPGGFEARSSGQYFQLVYSVAKCCYSGEPLIQHFIQSTVPEDKFNTDNIQTDGARPVEVRGTLKVDVTRDPETNKINGIYHLTVESVRPS